MTSIPEKPWESTAVDFGGPHPDGHYNLVAIDKGTRFPEVKIDEKVPSINCKSNIEKLKRMLAVHGTPRIVSSDNGPPFNSKEFEEFTKREKFEYHKVTPLHPIGQMRRGRGETKAGRTNK